MLKIGVIHDEAYDYLLDGNDQSGYFLYKILKKIKFDVDLVSFYKKRKFFNEETKNISYSDINKYDLFIDISKNLDDEIIKLILLNGKKIISNIHDNLLLKLKESLINNSLNEKFNFSFIKNSSNSCFISDNYSNISDAIEIITRSKVYKIPFLWDPDFCLSIVKDFNSLNLNKEDLNKIGIFESNQSFYKNSIIPMSICEGLERLDSSIIKFIFIANIEDKMNVRMFNHYYNNLLLKKNNKLFPYHRSGLSYLISKNAINTVVSTQIMEGYSYTYNETLYLNRPLIHNSNLYKNVGFFYKDFEVKKASKILLNAIKNFDINENKEKNIEFLNKFSTDNIENQTKIKNIILEEIKK